MSERNGLFERRIMTSNKEPVITVRAVYEGTQTARQAFMTMIIEKLKSQRNAVDNREPRGYNKANPNRGVHSGNGESP